MDKISVILPTYNEPLSYIDQAINSMLKQTYKNIEVIVIIDNPNRMDLIKLASEKTKKDNRAIVLVNKRNLGLTKSLNNAIQLANGKYIARMDADDISEPGRLEKQLKFLRENNYDLVGCNIINIDENSGIIANTPTSFPCSDGMVKKYLRYNNPLAHPAWLGKAELFKNNKYIDFPACEDYEFLARAALQGKRLGNLPETLLKYRINSNGISSSKKILQKTSLSYVRKKYKKHQFGNYNEFIKYLASRNGKRKQAYIQEYYSENAILKNYLKEKKYFKFTIKFFLLLLLNNYAREAIYNTAKSKRLKIKCKNKGV